MNLAGLDLSITATGLAHTSSAGPCTHTIKTKGTSDERLVEIKNQIFGLAGGAEKALIEGLGFASMKVAISAMVHGVVRGALIEAHLPYAVVPPNSLKKYATGVGAADKTLMAMAAYKRAGVEFPNDNECDAWWCWVMLHDYLGDPLFSLPAVQRDQLAKIEKRWGEW